MARCGFGQQRLEYLRGKSSHIVGLLTTAMIAVKGTHFTHTGDSSRESMRSFWECGDETLRFPPDSYSLRWVLHVFTVESFQRSLVSQTSLIIAQYESGNRSHCSYDEHTQLIDAIEARDATLAVNLMMHHMDHIDSKLNLDEESASDDLHAVFSHLLQTKKPGRSSVKL